MSFWDVTLKLLSGFQDTLLLFSLTLLLSLPLGLVFTFGSMSKFKPLKYLVRGFVYIIRGTPLMLQLMVVVYIPGIVFGSPIVRWPLFGGNTNAAYFTGVLIAFVINYACYFSEIYRGGIESISQGQYEAGQVLGMKKGQIFFRVVLLQVIKRIVPPVANETITLVKDTALAATVNVYEIYFMSKEVLNTEFIIWPLFYSGAFYLIFNAGLTWLFNRLEKKLGYFRS